MMFVRPCLILVLFMMTVPFGCAEEDGEGTLELELWGEEYIEEEIPQKEFADGYSVQFENFIINIGEISVSAEDAEPAIERDEMTLWDLTEDGPFAITSVTVAAGKYDHTAYTIAKATDDSAVGNVRSDEEQLMVDNGYSVYVKGEATDGDVTKRFAWGFKSEKRYDPCSSLAEISDGDEDTIQITIHGDHLFYDDAISEDPELRFNDMALADIDEDDEITEQELLDYQITALPNYMVGNLEIDNLWDFISHMISTLGHIDGEGHCH